MAFSNYPGGFSNGVTLQNVPITIPHPGRVFWVNNSTVLAERGISGSNTNPGTYIRPFSTLDYAVGKCTANRGDVIYVMPGYTQSLTGALAVACDVAGISIIGLGRGTKRPKFTYDNAAGQFTISANNVHIENLWFVPSVTAVTSAIDVLTSTGWQIINCEFSGRETAGDEFNNSITIAASCDNGLIQNCYFDSQAEGSVYAISAVTPTELKIYDNIIMGDYSTANVGTITGAGVRCQMLRNILINGQPGDINAVANFTQSAAGTWFVGGNVFSADVASAVLQFTNYTSTINLGNLYTDDTSMAATAVDRTASIVVMVDG